MKKTTFILCVLIFILAISSVSAFAYEDNFYKLSDKDLEKLNLNQDPILNFSYAGGTFLLFPYNETHDVIIYENDLNRAYAIEKVDGHLITFPALDSNLRMVMDKSDNTSTGRAYGYIDKNNNIVIPAKYELGDAFLNGIAGVGFFDENDNFSNLLINEQGEVITNKRYPFISRFIMPKSYINTGSKYLFNIFESPYFQDYTPTKYAFFMNDLFTDTSTFTWGAKKYERIHKELRGERGIIDKNGNELQPTIYSNVGIGDNDIIAVSKDNKNFGYITPNGQVLLPFTYKMATRFRNGKAAIINNTDDKDQQKIAFIDENMNIIQDFKPAPHWYDIYYIGDIDGMTEAFYDKFDSSASTWARPYVFLAEYLGILSDDIKTNYQKNINREEFCKLVVQTMARQAFNDSKNADRIASKIESAYRGEDTPFTDTNNEFVKVAYNMGIVRGKSATKFDPHGEITRQEAAIMLVNAFAKCNNENNVLQRYRHDRNDFKDLDTVAKWAKDYVISASDIELMGGMSNGTFSPTNKYTVEQAIITMISLYDHLE